MAWTAPRTWVTAEIVTAAMLNTHLRDNLLETSSAAVTTAGDLAYADAANSMGSRLGIGAASGLLVSDGSAPIWRIPASDVDTGTESSDLTAYLSLAESGGGVGWLFAAEIEVTVVTGTRALVLWKAQLSNSSAGSSVFMSFAVSGASTIAAVDSRSITYESSIAGDVAGFGGFDHTAVTPGTNTFTLHARVNSGTGTISRPEIVVIPL